MLCVGPVCVPVWQVGVIVLALLGPLKSFASYFYDICSRRRRREFRGEEDDERHGDTRSTQITSSSSFLSLYRGAGKCPVYEDVKRRLTQKEIQGVLRIRSDEEMKQFWKKIRENDGDIVFADFSAQWCGPCRAISPFYELLSAGYEGVFISVDIDECPHTAEAAGVDMLPTLALLQETSSGALNPWKVVASISGANARKWEEFVAGYTVPRSSTDSSSGSRS